MTTEPFCSPTTSGTGAATTLLALSLFLAPSVGAADRQPLELRKIMQELGEEMQLVAGAISREDWDAVIEAAPKIAPVTVRKMRTSTGWALSWVNRSLGNKVASAPESMRADITRVAPG